MKTPKIFRSIIPDDRPSENEWMKEFKVSSQYFGLQTLELVHRDENIFFNRNKETASSDNLFGINFKTGNYGKN